jgi:hypothetical protein
VRGVRSSRNPPPTTTPLSRKQAPCPKAEPDNAKTKKNENDKIELTQYNEDKNDLSTNRSEHSLLSFHPFVDTRCHSRKGAVSVFPWSNASPLFLAHPGDAAAASSSFAATSSSSSLFTHHATSSAKDKPLIPGTAHSTSLRCPTCRHQRVSELLATLTASRYQLN